MQKNVVVMTGATSGFGVAWLKALTKDFSADFYIVARSNEKFESLAADLPKSIQQNLHYVPCDLVSLKSVALAAQMINKQVDSIDILINNAGVFPTAEPSFTEENIELTLVVNHLAPFLLTMLLEERLSNASSARVVNTSSFQHYPANLNVDDLGFTNSHYTPMLAYQNSKLCTVLFTRALSQYLSNTNVNVNCFDPGIVDTDMTASALPKLLSWAHPLLRVFFRSLEKGAETGVYLSLNKSVEEQSGGYYLNKKLKTPSVSAQSKDLSEQLWQVSMGLVEPYLDGSFESRAS
jgi:NAD(P)-dependent dehydrogenase (short-subunit alcohol dehydrogenase family)